MAFSDGPARFWQVDLTTRLGAEAAAHQGGTACFAMAAMGVFGIFVGGGLAGFNTVEGMSVMIAAALEALVGLIAGLRLRSDKGAFWGLAALILMAIEFVGKIVMISPGGIVVAGIVCVFIANGLRGAFALRREKGFDDDVVDVFR